MSKIAVGQTLWVVTPSYTNNQPDKEPREYRVSAVGKKYFQLLGFHGRFSLETLKQDSESNYKSQCYRTLQEILDKHEKQKLEDGLRKSIGNWGTTKFSLDQLRRISEIISEPKLIN